MTLGMEVGLGPGNIVLDGNPSPTKRGGGTALTPPPIFGPCLLWYCGQTAGWIKMPLDMEVGLGPGDIVLDRDPAPPKGAEPPIFGPCLFDLWPNG